MYVDCNGSVELRPSKKGRVLVEGIGVFGEFPVGFGKFAVRAVELLVAAAIFPLTLETVVVWDLILVRAVENSN